MSSKLSIVNYCTLFSRACSRPAPGMYTSCILMKGSALSSLTEPKPSRRRIPKISTHSQSNHLCFSAGTGGASLAAAQHCNGAHSDRAPCRWITCSMGPTQNATAGPPNSAPALEGAPGLNPGPAAVPAGPRVKAPEALQVLQL